MRIAVAIGVVLTTLAASTAALAAGPRALRPVREVSQRAERLPRIVESQYAPRLAAAPIRVQSEIQTPVALVLQAARGEGPY